MFQKVILISAGLLLAASFAAGTNIAENPSAEANKDIQVMPAWIEGRNLVGDITAINTPEEGGIEGGAEFGEATLSIREGGVTAGMLSDDGTTGQVLTSTGGSGVTWQDLPDISDYYWALTGNSGTDPADNFLGTIDSQALEIRVHNQRALRIEPAYWDPYFVPNIIGGCPDNSVKPGYYGCTIGGGGRAGAANRITGYTAYYATISGGLDTEAADAWCTIGGGMGNTVWGKWSTVGGGIDNTAGDGSSTVGGGDGNTASGSASTISGGMYNVASGERSTVGGGNNNTASGYGATVGGGFDNTASGQFSTVGGGINNTASKACTQIPGGCDNIVAGYASFAAGCNARALHDGVFVWSDGDPGGVESSAEGQFIVQAAGHVFITTNGTLPADKGLINTSTGATLSEGGSWTNASDRSLKEGFCPVDEKEVLKKVSELPITTWRYKNEDKSVTHIGPTGQDFHAAFGVGADDKSISTVDASGVALAAIQALYKENQELKSQVDDLTRRLEALEKEIH